MQELLLEAVKIIGAVAVSIFGTRLFYRKKIAAETESLRANTDIKQTESIVGLWERYVKQLGKDMDRLEKDLDDIKLKNIQLEAELGHVRDKNQQLEQENEELRGRVDALEKENTELKAAGYDACKLKK